MKIPKDPYHIKYPENGWQLKWIVYVVVVIGFATLFYGCSGALGNVDAVDPVERGLSYIALAIVTHGILNFFT